MSDRDLETQRHFDAIKQLWGDKVPPLVDGKWRAHGELQIDKEARGSILIRIGKAHRRGGDREQP